MRAIYATPSHSYANARMAAPTGAVVKIAPYRWLGSDAPPGVGDFLATSAGSAYQILDVRTGRSPRRLSLTCLKLDGVASIPDDARVVQLRWFSRDRRRSH